MKTLRDRCRIDSETGCWRWSLRVEQGAARVVIRQPNGDSKVVRGRRAALMLAGVKVGASCWPRDCCAHDDCVNPAHAQTGTREQWGRYLSKSGKWSGNPERAKAAREQGHKMRALTPEQVAHVRRKEMTQREYGELYGVSQNCVSAVQRYLRYMDVGVQSKAARSVVRSALTSKTPRSVFELASAVAV